jgi:hypothetical protein
MLRYANRYVIHANRRLGYFPEPDAYGNASKGRRAQIWRRSMVWAAADRRQGMGGGHRPGAPGAPAIYEAQRIPGLPQTPMYARALAEADLRLADDARDKVVEATLEPILEALPKVESPQDDGHGHNYRPEILVATGRQPPKGRHVWHRREGVRLPLSFL